MRNLINYKTFEAEQMNLGIPVLATSEEELTNYYKCNKCGKSFYLFNETTENCSDCRTNDIVQISVFDFFTELKKGDRDLYKKEIGLQKKRSENIVDLVDTGLKKERSKLQRKFN